MGPAKRARVVDLEAVVGHRGDTGGTQLGDIDFVTIGALWMLRGAEAAALLRDQVTVSEDTSQASFVLGAFKTNPTGRECTRTLRCSCGRTPWSASSRGEVAWAPRTSTPFLRTELGGSHSRQCEAGHLSGVPVRGHV